MEHGFEGKQTLENLVIIKCYTHCNRCDTVL
jgi:hypothetical protein